MKVERREGNTERRVMIGLIVSTPFLAKIAARWIPEGLFASAWANRIAKWCVDHYARYDKAPGKGIQATYETWAEDSQDKEGIEGIGTLLSSISGEYAKLKKEINVEHLSDIAAGHFDRIMAERRVDKAQQWLEAGDTAKAIEAMQDAKPIQMGSDAWVDPFRDMEGLREAFERKSDPILTFPGDLGEFFGTSLERDGFIGIMGQSKRGKCVRGDMLVLQANGRRRRIRDIVRDRDTTPVIAYDEITMRMVPVVPTDFWNNGDKRCWKVVTKTGREVVTTRNHQYLTPSGWKMLDSIKVGDYIAVPKSLPVFGDIAMNEDELKFLAYMLADGSCTASSLAFTKADPALVSDFKGICDRLGIGHRANGIAIYLSRVKGIVARYPECLHHVSSKTKKLPAVLFRCPKSQVAMFLKTFFSCDGGIVRGRSGDEVSLTLANRQMLRQISHLLHRFGIVHSLSAKKAVCRGKTFPAWRIDIRSGAAVCKFMEEINMLSYKGRVPIPCDRDRSFLDMFPSDAAGRFYAELDATCPGGAKGVLGEMKASAVRQQISKGKSSMRCTFQPAANTEVGRKYLGAEVLWDEVKSISDAGVKDTYDIAIPAYHNFVANDCIVHNSWLLQEMAYQGLKQGRKVAMFQTGDLSMSQIRMRLAIRSAKRPYAAGTIKIPKTLIRSRRQLMATYREKTFRDKLDLEKASAALLREMGEEEECRYRLEVHSNTSISMAGIFSKLDDWDRDGYVPDAIIIDYADILAPVDKKEDKLERIVTNWRWMRRLSQERHCLVITATQTNTESFSSSLMRRNHFSGDRRKFDEVTGMFAINATDKEKNEQLMRFNWLQLRDGEFTETKCVTVAGCLAIASPMICSCW